LTTAGEKAVTDAGIQAESFRKVEGAADCRAEVETPNFIIAVKPTTEP